MISSFRIWLTVTIVAVLLLSGIETVAHVSARPPRAGPPGPPAPRPRRPRAPAERPSTPPRGRVGTQLGPEVPANAWIEAEVTSPTDADWKLLLARSGEGDAIEIAFADGRAVAVARSGAAEARLGDVAFAPREGAGVTELWARRRDDAWSVWIAGRLAFAFTARPARGARAGFANDEPGPGLRRLSVRACAPPVFSDDFMREGPDHTWRALSGEWELAGIRFPERSANPFALRARFRLAEPYDAFVQRRWEHARTGLGVNLSSWRGLIDIERITGGGPADLAGVEEHDIVVAIDGQPYLSMNAGSLHEDLPGPQGSRVTLTLLKRGADSLKDVVLTRRRYRWARTAYGQAVPGSSPHTAREAARSLAASGLSSWDDYRLEASVSAVRDGGAGVAFAVRSARDYHVFASGLDGDASRLAIARVRDGTPEILAETPWVMRPQTYYRMAVDLTGPTVRTFVDGEPALETPRADVPAGRIGLWASAPAIDPDAADRPRPAAGAYFDDVAVSHDPAATAPPDDERPSPALATEIDMRRWANPADEWELDYASGWWWERFRFPGHASLAVSPGARFETLRAVLGARKGDLEGGVTFAIARDDGACAVTYRGETVARVDGLHGRQGFRLGVDGATVRILVDDVERARCELASPPPGEALAVHGLENISERGVLTATSRNVLQYHFRRAPVDWAVERGGWGVINKWICDPRFSWFGGHGRSLAAIWNKRRLGGDVSLDFYAALVMTSDDPPYERVGDFACTILADGATLESGYTLVVSGGRNEWTRLYGGGKLLAETRDAAHRLPSNVNDSPDRRVLHQRWFHITLERVNGEVRALFDGERVLSCPDTLARADGYAALWTQDNGMLVSRARLAAGSIGPRRSPLATWGARARRRELQGLVNTAFGEVSTNLTVDGVGPDGRPAVRVTNASCGGLFAASSVEAATPADVVSFAFRTEPGARVDLYLVTDGADPLSPGPARVLLTGPEGERERHPVLWRAPVRADGAWHRVVVDLWKLRDKWRATHHGARLPFLGRVRPVFANLEDGEGEAYLPAGLGGNAPGARYWVSGLTIGPRVAGDASPPAVKRILIAGEEGTPEGAVRVLFDDDRSGVDGSSIVAVLSRKGAAGGSPTPGNKILPPSVVDVEPGRVALPLPRTDLPPEVVLGRGNPALSFDAEAQELEIDLAAAVGATSDGTGLTLEMRTYADGARRRGEAASRRIAHEARDTTPPAITYLAFNPSIPGEIDLDFEPNARTRRELAMRAAHGAPSMRLDSSTAAGGASSLKISAPELASPIIFRLSSRMTDLARIKELTFEYRIGPQLPVNLYVRGHQGYRGVLFTDTGDPLSDRSRGVEYVGRVEDVRADRRWHRATVPLSRLFALRFPGPPNIPAHGVYLMDWGWNGLWPGDSWWIDNVHMTGVRRGAALSARWRALDASGATEAAWLLDGHPTTRVDPEISNRVPMANGAGAANLRIAHRLLDGEAYFHLAVKDAHGNWSDTVHKRLLVDNTPPEIERAEPSDGAVTPSRVVTVAFDDFAGVDAASLMIQLDITPEQGGGTLKQAFRVDGRGCTFDAKEGILKLRLRPPFVARPLAGRASIAARVLCARDRVGNSRVSPYAWSWTFDPSVDHTPPPAPRLRVTTCRPYQGYFDGPTFGDTNDFERERGPVEGYRGCTVALSDDAACFGERGARCAITGERGGAFSLRLRERYWYTDRRPFLTFMYRLPPRGIDALALELDLLRGTVEVPVHGPRAPEQLVADGAWHRAVVNMGRHVERSKFEFVRYRNVPLKIGARILLTGSGAPGATFDIDDLEFVLADWRGLALIVDHDTDEAGVDALSIVWDFAPDTIPPEEVTNPLPPFQGDTLQGLPVPRAVMSGRRYLHIRSRDGSGNWSETGHVEVDFRGR